MERQYASCMRNKRLFEGGPPNKVKLCINPAGLRFAENFQKSSGRQHVEKRSFPRSRPGCWKLCRQTMKRHAGEAQHHLNSLSTTKRLRENDPHTASRVSLHSEAKRCCASATCPVIVHRRHVQHISNCNGKLRHSMGALDNRANRAAPS
jgi:hypothetical protein